MEWRPTPFFIGCVDKGDGLLLCRCEIVRQTVTHKQIASPTTAASALRQFFHDCFPNGCDGSVLITSNTFYKTDRDEDINLSLLGDAFDVVIRAKSALKMECPVIVSCSDILAMGGSYYPVRLGRKDSFISRATDVEDKLLKANMPMSQIISLFTSRGFTVKEMVALTGSHTVGFSHRKEFANRVFGGNSTRGIDPTLNPRFVEGIKKACANYQKRPTIAAFNEMMTPNKFNSMYYQNQKRTWFAFALRCKPDLVLP